MRKYFNICATHAVRMISLSNVQLNGIIRAYFQKYTYVSMKFIAKYISNMLKF